MPTRKVSLTMAAPGEGELDAMYSFFNLLGWLFESEEPDLEDIEGADYPVDWVKAARRIHKKYDGSSEWKAHFIQFMYNSYQIYSGWRRVVGGFDCLFDNVCDPESTVLTYKKEIVEAVNRGGMVKSAIFPDGHVRQIADLSLPEFIRTSMYNKYEPAQPQYDEYLRLRDMYEFSELSATSQNKVELRIMFRGETVTSLQHLQTLITENDEE